MSDWEIMVHLVDLAGGLSPDEAVPIPSGWEPIGIAARQGNKATILCKRVAGGPPPAGDTPVLTSLTPNTLPAGSTPASIDVVGSGFDQSCDVYADGQIRTTFFIDATHLQYTARPDQVAAPETRQITVQGDTGTSNALTFTFT